MRAASRELYPGDSVVSDTPREGARDSRVVIWGIAATVAYIAIASAGLLLVPLEPGRQLSIAGITSLIPLLASGGVFARLVADEQAARATRHWRLFGIGCVVMAGGMAGWVLSGVFGKNSVATASSAAIVIAIPMFIRALAGRVRSTGTISTSRLDLLDLLIVVTIVVGYIGTFAWLPMLERRGYAIAILLVGGFVVTSTAFYATLLLLRRGKGSIAPADRAMLIPFATMALLEVGASYHLWYTDGPASPLLFVGGLVGLAPLPLMPLLDLHFSNRASAAPPARRRSSAIVLFALIALPPLYIYPFAARTLVYWQVIFRGFTTVAVASLIAARQVVMVNENRELADTQQSLARLWKREAARGQALLGLLRRVAEGKELSVVLDAALAAAVETTGATRAFFFTREKGEVGSGSVIKATGLTDDEIAEIESVDFDPVSLFRTFSGGRTVTYAKEPVPGLSETSSRFGERQLAAVAVTGWESGGLGALCCDSGQSDYVFAADDLEMLEAIIDHIGIDLGRERLFKELAASEERYRLLVEDATDGVCELDEEDRILFTNAAFAEMVGRPIGSLPGRRLEEILEIERDSAAGGSRELIAAVERQGETAHVELRTALRRDGRIQAVARDVTERTVAAERIESLYRELQEKERDRASAFAQLIRASDDERAKIASDLHDGPVQELSTLAIQLDLAKTFLKRDQAKQAEELLADIRKRISREVLALRHLMMELRPPVLDERGLYQAIENYARTFELETGIVVRLAETDNSKFTKPVETVLYRITQEALANVRKHSMAREVEIELSGTPEAGGDSDISVAHLVISDDGVGFDPDSAKAAVARGHIGLASMKERAELAGGECAIESSPGQGTVIRVQIGAPVMSHAGN
ncbi:MAG: hypothetical protein DCC49_03600 [Acidobacteria bacterium]|nr:MAG: hypothetical protein DCC49_03600 [Acidobacteriota bacterium]